ncbi:MULTISPECIES: hypothetical protein [Pseudocitrobacter]|uniref:hypothetical protein n=1 Tax=Pseudocitrobacter TaxID=1504576 RepID=UPI00165D38DF|nr:MULTISPECIES: hypothetical protein [Pseudocitrobacter]
MRIKIGHGVTLFRNLNEINDAKNSGKREEKKMADDTTLSEKRLRLTKPLFYRA